MTVTNILMYLVIVVKSFMIQARGASPPLEKGGYKRLECTFSLRKSRILTVLEENGKAMTNFNQLDKTWAEFSTLDGAARRPRVNVAMKQNHKT
jgi:hypothetical protein